LKTELANQDNTDLLNAEIAIVGAGMAGLMTFVGLSFPDTFPVQEVNRILGA